MHYWSNYITSSHEEDIIADSLCYFQCTFDNFLLLF